MFDGSAMTGCRSVRPILMTMDIDISGDEAAIVALEAAENRPWLAMLEPVMIVRAFEPPQVGSPTRWPGAKQTPASMQRRRRPTSQK